MKQIIKTILLASITTFITFLLIKFPNEAFEASVHGLNMWWEIVFPSLLPFFITAELLIGFGVVTFFGVLFEPIMRPLFNVPGVGSFAWIMGMASGYPSGAKISARLREEKQLTKIEAERLISFTNASSPLFIFGAVSIGFFHDVKLGLLIAISHYLGNACVGICMRFHGKTHEKSRQAKGQNPFSFRFALKSMHDTRINDKRPFGEVIGDSVLNSIKTLVMIGGFIILFSVLTKLLFLVGLTPVIANILGYGLEQLSLPSAFALPLISGMFEITQGAQMISQTSVHSIMYKAIIVSFILGFNGFSVQAQVSSIISKTDIRFMPYFFSRILHGIFASLFIVLLFKPLYVSRQVFSEDDIPVTQDVANHDWLTFLHFLKAYGPLITITFLGISAIIMYKKHFKQSS